ncbi:MAG: adenosylcobinamide-phosphate synthase CbiB [Gammaproteobacteria bacterium]|nr:adenosylcobinamide-phosphate synthase CbiB [Gammaproteobacteria bacterium]
MTTVGMLLALLIDWRFGEPKRYHPLAGFGLLANKVERLFYGSPQLSSLHRIVRGTLAIITLLVPITLIVWWLSSLPVFGTVFSIILLTVAIGHKSLHDHVRPIARALFAGDEQQARHLTSRIVSRDSETLNIPRATIESVLENGSDSVFAALFWFAVAGAPGVVLYRMANTLDAMWGYRHSHYLFFGRFAARLDDVLNYIPARLTAISYALIGRTCLAFRCWRQQAKACDSPNAGPVMAAGAGALNITMGGPAQYHGQWHQRPILGEGPEPEANDIVRALQLVHRSVLLWLVVMLMMTGFSYA